MSRVAEQGDRYEDMYKFMRAYIEARAATQSLVHYSSDERNMMSVAFKNLITPKRTTWRTIIAVEQ
jgi:hypothetical protein